MAHKTAPWKIAAKHVWDYYNSKKVEHNNLKKDPRAVLSGSIAGTVKQIY